MRRIIETTEADGLEALLGEYVQIWCVNYIYAGRLIGVNKEDCVLGEPHVVYETGKLDGEKFTQAEPCGAGELYVRLSAIESYSLAPQMVE